MKRNHLHSFAVIAMTAAALALAVPGNAQGRRPGGGLGGSRPSSSQSSSPRSSSSSMSSSPRSSSSSMSSSPRSSSPTMSTPRSSSSSMGSSVNRPSGNYNSRPSGSSNGGFHGSGNNGGNRPSGGNGSGSGFNSRPGRSDAAVTPSAPTVRGGDVKNNNRPSGQVNRGYINPGGNNDNNRPGGNMGGGNHGGNDRPGGNMGGGNHGGNDRPGGNMGGNNGGHNRPGGNMGRPGGNNRPGGNMDRPGGHNRPGGNMGRPGGNNRPGGNMGRPGGRPHAGINHGGPRPDYNRYRWHDSFRPRGPRDRWYDYYRYNRWSWLYPIAPPVRPWRPRVIWYYRPIIPTGYRFYTSAPIITGVLGLEFGTLLDASLNYLYYNGYSIDGYQDNVVYLRDVNLMGYSWPDVMLQYNDAGGLCYAEFATSSTYSDNYRFNNLYNTLCSTYGTPISNGNGYYSWYGGDRTGFINLNFAYDNGRYYTVMTLGV